MTLTAPGVPLPAYGASPYGINEALHASGGCSHAMREALYEKREPAHAIGKTMNVTGRRRTRSASCSSPAGAIGIRSTALLMGCNGALATFREALHACKKTPHACSKPSFAFVEAQNRNNGPRHARSGFPIAINRSPIAISATPTAFRASHRACNEALNAVNGSWHACNGSCHAYSVIPDAYSATRDALPQTWTAAGVRAYFTSNFPISGRSSTFSAATWRRKSATSVSKKRLKSARTWAVSFSTWRRYSRWVGLGGAQPLRM